MRSIFGYARCDAKDCRNAYAGTNEQARNDGWYAFNSGGANTFTVYYCPVHNPTVQNSGHPEKENTMNLDQSPIQTSDQVSANASAQFIRIRQRIVAILLDDLVTEDGLSITDVEKFDEDSLTVAAEDIMLAFTMQQTRDDAGF